MVKRLPGENTPHDTRAESYERVPKQLRYRQIKDILYHHPALSAREIAVIMYERGITPAVERNVSAPRLTEMSFIGMVEPVGKKICQYTGKTVTVYDLTPITREQMKGGD